MSSDQLVHAQAPAWFRDALAAPGEIGSVEVRGTAVRYRCWGPGAAPAVVLVHGDGAHARWWDHVAPLLATPRRRVVAVDLPGHGDSGRRSRYSLDSWAGDVLAVARATSRSARPVIVGHSMGGQVSLRAAYQAGADLAGVITIDMPVRRPPQDFIDKYERLARTPVKIYPTFEQALDRFRVVPPQQTVLPYVYDHIARTSIRQVEGGWTWKYDPRLFGRDLTRPVFDETAPPCRLALFQCEYGLISDELARQLHVGVGGAAPVVKLPNAAHHVMFDEPLLLAGVLRTVLDTWAHDDSQAHEDSQAHDT